MGRQSKVLLTTLGLVSLLGSMSAGTAFAAADVNAGNTTVAAELIPAAGPFLIPAVNTAYQTGGAVAASSQILIALSGGNFTPATNVDICIGTVSQGTAVVAGAPLNTSVTITVANPITDASILNFQPDGCVAAATALNNVNVNAGAQAGTVVDLTVDNALNPGDPNIFATTSVALVKNQFTAVVGLVVSKLSFAGDQKIFVVDAPALPAPPRTNTPTTSQASILISSDESIGNKVMVTALGTCVDTLAPADVVNLEVAGDLNGLASIQYGPPGAPANTIPVTPVAIAAGKLTLPIPGNLLLICRSTDPGNIPATIQLTAVGAAGTVAIPTGIRTSEITLGGAGQFGAGNLNEMLPVTNSHDIKLDATTFFIPLIVKNDTGDDTFIKLSSSSQLSGANGVSGSILTDDGTYAICPFGDITPGTPFEINGGQWETCIADAGKSADLSVGQSAKVVVNAPEGNVQGLTNLVFGGRLQRVPMQILDPGRGE